jgi:DNA-directed RNA polymerase subunit RPC12/RpoP
MKLNARELGTALAALRYWQQEIVKQGGLTNAANEYDPIASDNGLQEPLTAEEIDELCQSLNFGIRQVEEVPDGPKSRKLVDIIASGYEWNCPKCDHLNNEIEWTEKVKCKKCGYRYKTNPPDHAF